MSNSNIPSEPLSSPSPPASKYDSLYDPFSDSLTTSNELPSSIFISDYDFTPVNNSEEKDFHDLSFKAGEIFKIIFKKNEILYGVRINVYHEHLPKFNQLKQFLVDNNCSMLDFDDVLDYFRKQVASRPANTATSITLDQYDEAFAHFGKISIWYGHFRLPSPYVLTDEEKFENFYSVYSLIIDTEEIFLRNLRVIINNVIMPVNLKDTAEKRNILSDSTVSLAFNLILEIYKISSIFLLKLKENFYEVYYTQDGQSQPSNSSTFNISYTENLKVNFDESVLRGNKIFRVSSPNFHERNMKNYKNLALIYSNFSPSLQLFSQYTSENFLLLSTVSKMKKLFSVVLTSVGSAHVDLTKFFILPTQHALNYLKFYQNLIWLNSYNSEDTLLNNAPKSKITYDQSLYNAKSLLSSLDLLIGNSNYIKLKLLEKKNLISLLTLESRIVNSKTYKIFNENRSILQEADTQQLCFSDPTIEHYVLTEEYMVYDEALEKMDLRLRSYLYILCNDMLMVVRKNKLNDNLKIIYFFDFPSVLALDALNASELKKLKALFARTNDSSLFFPASIGNDIENGTFTLDSAGDQDFVYFKVITKVADNDSQKQIFRIKKKQFMATKNAYDYYKKNNMLQVNSNTIFTSFTERAEASNLAKSNKLLKFFLNFIKNELYFYNIMNLVYNIVIQPMINNSHGSNLSTIKIDTFLTQGNAATSPVTGASSSTFSFLDKEKQNNQMRKDLLNETSEIRIFFNFFENLLVNSKNFLNNFIQLYEKFAAFFSNPKSEATLSEVLTEFSNFFNTNNINTISLFNSIKNYVTELSIFMRILNNPLFQQYYSENDKNFMGYCNKSLKDVLSFPRYRIRFYYNFLYLFLFNENLTTAFNETLGFVESGSGEINDNLDSLEAGPKTKFSLDSFLSYLTRSEKSAGFLPASALSCLKISLNLMKGYETEIKSVIKSKENYETLLSIQNSFTSMGSDSFSSKIISAERQFIKSGEFIKVCRKKNKTFNFWLFNDYLCYGSPNIGGEKYTLNRTIKLTTCYVSKLKDSKNLANFSKILTQTEVNNAFEILSTEKSFIIIVTSSNLYEEWFETLRKTIDEEHRLNGININTLNLAPLWQQDKDSDECSICSAPFTIWFRRHHCRKCGGLVCGNHSKNSLIIDNINKTSKQRVCDNCFFGRDNNAPTNSVRIETQNFDIPDSIPPPVPSSAPPSAPPTSNTPSVPVRTYGSTTPVNNPTSYSTPSYSTPSYTTPVSPTSQVSTPPSASSSTPPLPASSEVSPGIAKLSAQKYLAATNSHNASIGSPTASASSTNYSPPQKSSSILNRYNPNSNTTPSTPSSYSPASTSNSSSVASARAAFNKPATSSFAPVAKPAYSSSVATIVSTPPPLPPRSSKRLSGNPIGDSSTSTSNRPLSTMLKPASNANVYASILAANAEYEKQLASAPTPTPAPTPAPTPVPPAPVVRPAVPAPSPPVPVPPVSPVASPAPPSFVAAPPATATPPPPAGITPPPPPPPMVRPPPPPMKVAPPVAPPAPAAPTVPSPPAVSTPQPAQPEPEPVITRPPNPFAKPMSLLEQIQQGSKLKSASERVLPPPVETPSDVPPSGGLLGVLAQEMSKRRFNMHTPDSDSDSDSDSGFDSD